MARLRRGAVALAAAGTIALVLPAAPAAAHEHRRVNGNDVVVGWLEEPAFAGFLNAVQFIVTRGDQPVENARLEVEVVFGGPDAEQRTDPMPLEPAFGAPGEYHATVIPTRAGQYTFHVTGSMNGSIDEVFTSGPETFNDIEEVSGVQFPEQDPSAGELGEAVTELQGQLDEAMAAAQEARDQAGTAGSELAAAREDADSAEDAAGLARWLAIGAGAVAVVAIIVALVRRPRSRGV
jgi:YtkA-like